MSKIGILFILAFFSFPVCAEKITLPSPSGPYAVGTQSFEFDDSTRSEKNAWWGTRKFVIQAYYPSSASTTHSPYMPETLNGGKVEGVTIYAHTELNAPIANKGPYPIIIMQPGVGGVRQAHTILCENLASHGYAVFSLDHPYVASFVRFKNGDVVTPHLWTMWRVKNNRDYRYEWFEKAVETSCQDIKLLIQELSVWNKSRFQNQLNLSRLGLMGHSFGGNVALRFGFNDPNIKAIIDVDSKLTERIVLPQNLQKKPVLFIRSNQYQGDVGNRLKVISNGQIVNFNVEHSAFEDIAYLAPAVPNHGNYSLFAKAWHFLTHKGPYMDHVGTNLGAYKKEEWFALYTKTVKDFWDKYLLRTR